MLIYLACTVRGDRGAVEPARALVARLEEAGHTVLTKHLLEADVERAEARLTEREVFDRDMRWLNEAGLLIAEASGSSYGVGFEVGYVLGRADRTGQKVILLFREDRRTAISRMIAGTSHPLCTTYAYRDVDDLLGFLDRTLVQSMKVEA